MGVRTALAVFILLMYCVDAQEGGVEFWREDFTMKCPGAADWKWHLNNNKEVTSSEKENTLKYDNSMKGPHYCTYTTTDGKPKKYFFYVQGKVCENCFELDGNMFLLAIIADVVFTVGVMFVIYNCSKKKSSDESSHASNEPSRPGGRPPPIPNPDYEPLNPRTQNQDPYSRLS